MQKQDSNLYISKSIVNTLIIFPVGGLRIQKDKSSADLIIL